MKAEQRTAIRAARSIGVDDAAIIGGGRHPRLVGTYEGRPFALPVGLCRATAEKFYAKRLRKDLETRT